METDTEIESLVESVRGARDVRPHWRVVDGWVTWRDVQRLSLAADALHDAARKYAEPPWAFETVLDHILDNLARRSVPGFAEAALRISALPIVAAGRPQTRGERQPHAAEYLAAGQQAETLISLFGRFGSHTAYGETLACLLQEMILRGFDADSVEETRTFRRLLSRIAHPLAWLPPSLSSMEASVSAYLPRFAYAPGPPPATAARGRRISTSNGAPFGFEIVRDPSREDRIRTSVMSWLEGSNGRAEVKLFRLLPANEGSVDPGALRSLGLGSIGSARDEEIDVKASSVETAFGDLFAASSSGGAYTPRRGGAYGRLDAWRSMGGLAGIAADASAESIQEGASRCSWFSFLANSGWFEEVAWDLGIVCVLPGGEEIAVLAATDTD